MSGIHSLTKNGFRPAVLTLQAVQSSSGVKERLLLEELCWNRDKFRAGKGDAHHHFRDAVLRYQLQRIRAIGSLATCRSLTQDLHDFVVSDREEARSPQVSSWLVTHRATLARLEKRILSAYDQFPFPDEQKD